MNKDKIQALKKITFALFMTTTLSSQAYANDELNEKSVYVKKTHKSLTVEDKVIADLEKKIAKKKAKKEAKEAAMTAAEKSALNILGDKDKAHDVALSIVGHKKLDNVEDQREKRLLSLAKNRAMQAAMEAATEKAFEVLQDEAKALKIANSLHLDQNLKKANPQGTKRVKAESSTSNVVTLNDIKEDEEKKRKSATSINRASTEGNTSPSNDKLNHLKTMAKVGMKALELTLKGLEKL